MSVLLIGTKLGMTRVYSAEGASVPVTVIHVQPNTVTQVRTQENDGYSAIQVGGGEMKARNATMPQIGHDAKAGIGPRRDHREYKVEDAGAFSLGQTLTVSDLEGTKYVDVMGTSKGKGFAGVMKRHHFAGLEASHGVERKHRSPGSIAAHATNRGFSGKLKKGKRMAGRMGNERVTMRSLDIVRIDADNNLLLVKGPVPGPARGTVVIRPAVRLNRSKAKKLADASA